MEGRPALVRFGGLERGRATSPRFGVLAIRGQLGPAMAQADMAAAGSPRPPRAQPEPGRVGRGTRP